MANVNTNVNAAVITGVMAVVWAAVLICVLRIFVPRRRGARLLFIADDVKIMTI